MYQMSAGLLLDKPSSSYLDPTYYVSCNYLLGVGSRKTGGGGEEKRRNT